VEYVLFLFLSLAAILSIVRRPALRIWAFRASLATACVAIIDVALGNWRWPLAPALALSLLLLLVTTYHRTGDRRVADAPDLWTRLRLIIVVLVGGAWLTIAVVLPVSFPMFASPAPSGPFGVGIRDIHLVDQSRAETMTERVDDHRELMIRVWYPASIPAGAQPEPFLRDVAPLQAIVSSTIPWPDLMLKHLTRIGSHSYANAPMSDGEREHAQPRFPVLVFSHGNSFYAGQNGLLMEHLASHGYVVFSIDHPYQASVVRFPDGRVARYKENWWDTVAAGISPDAQVRAANSYARAFKARTYEEYHASMREFLDSPVGLNKGLRIWLDDTAFLLDQLASIDSFARDGQPSRESGLDAFNGRLDLQRIGIFGMSYGGATAGQFCASDERCKAGINMDGMQLGEGAIDIRLNRPFMLMNADPRDLHLEDDSAAQGASDRNKPPLFGMNDFVYHQARIAYSLTIAGATHGNFSDFGIMMSGVARWTGMLGKIDGWVMGGLLNDYTLAFFNKHLLGRTEPLLDRQTLERPGVLAFEQRDGRTISMTQ
jgi:predicted dienelactone hydrolase